MSYCVNCGVKLKEEAMKCPLCDCPVINPYKEYECRSGEQMARMPVDNTHVADKRDLARFLIAVTLTLGAAACGIVDLCLNGKLTWSLIAAAACIATYVGVCIPLKHRKILAELYVLFDLAAVLFTIAVIAWRTDGFGWALPVAFPLSFALALCSMAIVRMIRRHRLRYFHIFSFSVVLAGILSVVTELVISRGTDISWSGIVMISCVCIACVLLIIAKSRKLTRRFHI